MRTIRTACSSTGLISPSLSIVSSWNHYSTLRITYQKGKKTGFIFLKEVQAAEKADSLTDLLTDLRLILAVMKEQDMKLFGKSPMKGKNPLKYHALITTIQSFSY